MAFWGMKVEGEMWDRPGGAPHVLRAIAENYMKLKWTPWSTSHFEPAFGLAENKLHPFGQEETVLKRVLTRNLWPDALDAAKFNAEIIRRTHAHRGWAVPEMLQSRFDTLTASKLHIEEQSLHHHDLLSKSSTEDERYLHSWHLQRLKWDQIDVSASLAFASKELEDDDFFPDPPRCSPPTPLLWQTWALSRTLEAAEATNHTRTCTQRFQRLDSNELWTYEDPSSPRFAKCLENERLKQHYIRTAYEKSKHDTETHCAEIKGCELLEVEDVWARARRMTDLHKRNIAKSEARLDKITEYNSTVPSSAAAAKAEINNAAKLLRQQIASTKYYELEPIERLIQSARHGGSELHWVLENLYELHGAGELGLGDLAKDACKKYQKKLYLKRIQRQIEEVGGIWDPCVEGID